MNSSFVAMTGLLISALACSNDGNDDLFLNDTSSALACRGPGGAGCHAGHPRTDDAGSGQPQRTDAGASCDYDDDCAANERCERRHGQSHCEAHHDNSGPGNGDGGDHDGDDDDHDGEVTADAGTETACDDEHGCDEDDRSGSNSGPH